MKMTMTDNRYSSSMELAQALAERVAKELHRAIETKGKASLAVSGGSTPMKFFAALSNHKLDWSNVTITLVDERWVGPENPRSNARLVEKNLLQNQAEAARFLPLYEAGKTVEEAIPQKQDELNEILPLDVVILGMGSDGHTASFFPGGSHLDSATSADTKNLLSPMQAENAGETRITLTLPPILQANFLALHIEGEEKQNVLAEALGDGPANDLPIRHILRTQANLNIFWAP